MKRDGPGDAAAALSLPGWHATLRLDAQPAPAAAAGAAAVAPTRLHAAHQGPLRLLKTLYPEGPGIAHAVLVHPPGGLVGGDRLEMQVRVASGAHLLVTTPAATRFYRSVAGDATQVLQAEVADGARLEWLPQETLAYDGCLAGNRWQVALAPGGALMAMELLALGLAASGRPFRHGRFEQRLEIAGLWREHGVIDAADEALLDGPCGLAGFRVLGTLVLAHGAPFAGPAAAAAEAALDAARAEAQAAHDGAAVRAGATLLHGRLLVLRVLAHDIEPAMRLLRRVRGLWRQTMWQLPAHEPRIWAS